MTPQMGRLLSAFLSHPKDEDGLSQLIAVAGKQDSALGIRLQELVNDRTIGDLHCQLTEKNYQLRYVQLVALWCFPKLLAINFATHCVSSVLSYLSDRTDLYWPAITLNKTIALWIKGDSRRRRVLEIQQQLANSQRVAEGLDSQLDEMGASYSVGKKISDQDKQLVKQGRAFELALDTARAVVAPPSNTAASMKRIVDTHLEIGPFSVRKQSPQAIREWQIERLRAVLSDSCDA